MVVVKVPENRESEMLDEFFHTSAFTFEGLDVTSKKSMRELEKFLIANGYKEEHPFCYYFKGSVMNEKYNLTGDNRYQDDLTFVVIPDFHNPMAKMMIGARWFDDIVANNEYREMGITL